MLGATFVGYHVPSPYNYHNWLSKIAALNHIFLKSAKPKVKLGNMQKKCVCVLSFWGGSFVVRGLLFDRMDLHSVLGEYFACCFFGEGWKCHVVSRGFLIRCEQRI